MTPGDIDVLIVEDDDSLREQIGQIVEMWGYRTRRVATVGAALAELERIPAQVVLTDLMLPDQPSYPIMRWAQARRPPPPVVVMTAYASLDSAIEALRQGAYDFLLKPVVPTELEAALVRARTAVALEYERVRAEHLRHIAEVALTLAHEINNPLAILMGELQLQLREGGEPIEPAALQIAIDSAKRIATVVRKIMALREVAYQEYGGLRLIDLDAGGE
ncbi:hypothetical protein SE17_24995 [Kouleothrix aurantiaca]|uniref:histidine kinase n=1 Tax=Kouleothrix aurantiaca TaxID=186479 RepID=A0A0P9CX38_9CHLR|nr:hypothetical protein SE17_24995 [Kouleothrix aurantiaca]